MRTKHTVFLALLVMAGTGALVAQNPPDAGFVVMNENAPGPPDPATMAQHRVQMLTKNLSLTPDQQKQALTIFTEAETSEADLHGNMKAAHDALETAVKSNDANGITQAAATIGSVTAEMTTIQGKADAAFYALLTPDQQTKFSELGPRTLFFGGGRAMMFGGPK